MRAQGAFKDMNKSVHLQNARTTDDRDSRLSLNIPLDPPSLMSFKITSRCNKNTTGVTLHKTGTKRS